MEHKIAITAHSGCEGTPDNSREHILAAIDSGADFLEIDVRMANGKLYLYHDRSEHPETCVDFKEFLRTILPHESLKVNNDLKEDGLIRPVLEAAEEIGGPALAARMYFTGETYGRGNDVVSLERYEGLRERIWLNTGAEELEAALDVADREGCPILNVYYGVITKESLALVRSRGKNFSGWTANSADVIAFLLSCGVTNITTRIPKLAIAMREAYEKENG